MWQIWDFLNTTPKCTETDLKKYHICPIWANLTQFWATPYIRELRIPVWNLPWLSFPPGRGRGNRWARTSMWVRQDKEIRQTCEVSMSCTLMLDGGGQDIPHISAISVAITWRCVCLEFTHFLLRYGTRDTRERPKFGQIGFIWDISLTF